MRLQPPAHVKEEVAPTVRRVRRIVHRRMPPRQRHAEANSQLACIDKHIYADIPVLIPGGTCPAAPPPERPLPADTDKNYSRFQASVRVTRRICSISSKCSWVQMSGGESWMTGSPRSSARQTRPASNRACDKKPRSNRSDSS